MMIYFEFKNKYCVSIGYKKKKKKKRKDKNIQNSVYDSFKRFNGSLSPVVDEVNK